MSPVSIPWGAEKQRVSAPSQLIAVIVPSDRAPGTSPWIALMDSSPPAWTKPPLTVAEIVGFDTDSAVNPAWMSMRPPEIALAKESASVSDWARTVRLPEAVTWPPPSRAETLGSVSALADDAETATSPMARLSTLPLVASSPRALTSIVWAPASPTVPTAGST